MTIYRVIETDGAYRAQKRVFWLFWRDVWWLSDVHASIPQTYTSAALARDAISRSIQKKKSKSLLVWEGNAP